MVLIGHPHAAHQLGLADVQRRHPLDNLLVVLRLGQHPARLLRIIAEGRRPRERWAGVKESDPRARSDTERPVSWLPAPGLETTSTIKLGRRQRTAATADFPTRTGIRAGISEAWKAWKAATRPTPTSSYAGRRHGVGSMSDRECACLTVLSARVGHSRTRGHGWTRGLKMGSVRPV